MIPVKASEVIALIKSFTRLDAHIIDMCYCNLDWIFEFLDWIGLDTRILGLDTVSPRKSPPGGLYAKINFWVSARQPKI